MEIPAEFSSEKWMNIQIFKYKALNRSPLRAGLLLFFWKAIVPNNV
jgi:hypothetical protein